MSYYAVLTWDGFEQTYTDCSENFDTKDQAISHALDLYSGLFFRGAPESDRFDFDVAISGPRYDWIPCGHFDYDLDDPENTIRFVRSSFDLADYL